MNDIVLLFFMFGLIAGLLRSELTLPPGLYETLSLLLLLAIGLKGGQSMAGQSFTALAPGVVIVILLGSTTTLVSYTLLKLSGRLPRPDAAALSAHYGSVSVATFAVGINWLTARGVSYEGETTIFLAVMEIPAILIGILLASGRRPLSAWSPLLREAFMGKGVTLLMGGMIMGCIAGPEGLQPVAPLFLDAFKAILAVFMLEMGLMVSRQVSVLKQQGVFLILFGALMPLLSAALGLASGMIMGMSTGGLTLMALLAASASYIAVPATMRMAIPAANPALSLAAVLGVTLPFNLLFGIPFYHQVATWLTGITT